MKKFILPILAAFAIVVATAGLLRLITPEGSWVCLDGEWVGQGNPSAPAPAEPCPGANENDEADNLVRLTTPLPGEQVSSPLLIAGEARGMWYFEADFPVELVAADGTVLAMGIATAQGEWMTEDFVPFTAVLDFSLTEVTAAELVLHKDNPSGLPEFDDERRIPLMLVP